MHDGVVRTLTHVRYVPRLKMNLILLGTMESKGYKYFGLNGVLRVTKGALVVIKGLRESMLYVLQGKIVTGSISVSRFAEENSKSAWLWHMQFDYVGEKV